MHINAHYERTINYDNSCHYALCPRPNTPITLSSVTPCLKLPT